MLVLSLIWPALAFAHTRGGEAVGFVSGFEHSISGLDDVVAMIAVTGRAADSAAKLRDLALPARLHRR